jgi:hypothetical protein
MHFCVEEFVAISVTLSAALPFMPRVRAWFRKLFPRPRTALDAEADDLQKWVVNVAPNIVCPEKDPYSGQRMLRDGSGYVVNGVIWPVYPVTAPGDYIRCAEGFRHATPEESQQIAAFRGESFGGSA